MSARMQPIIDEANLLVGALGAPSVDVQRLEERLRSVGGLRGLSWGGSEVLDGVLPCSILKRVEKLLLVAARLVSVPDFHPVIEDAEAVAAFFKPRIANLRTESFWVLFLDGRAHPVGYECVAQGTLTACLVHPREVFAPAIRARAAQIVVVHNHPSGDPSPSGEDINLTERLTEAGEIIGIPVIDHIVIAASGFRSLGLGYVTNCGA